MQYPHGRCEQCGERLYEHVDGGYVCHNCGTRYSESYLEGDGAGEKREADTGVSR
ncbi:hypothetical protein [Natrialbaceae archaeon AArc-T1-2]|uniref:hypothetical protein n=1 Tax=Natrialbaceae archaeon AArc-T1-2 TaxID=3053904 RepID=UPI00255B12B2|nr:hypothetical protein [Natrialbaceae archaeon AArc-T1-2]WIV68713.1 hypothetical protein QQ977_15915 [Natrialbaceae archaeon AArc-T1-2]